MMTSAYYSRPTTNPDFVNNPQSPPSLLDPPGQGSSPRRFDGDESTRDSLSDFSTIRLDGFDTEYSEASLTHRIGIASSGPQTYTKPANTTTSPTSGEQQQHSSPKGRQQPSSSSQSTHYRKRTYSTASNNSSATSSGGDKGGGERRAATKVCRVCGDKAFSYNFNVITCESCKAFFRRNANKEKEIRCPFNDNCDINIVSRRFCQRCRLAKCFRVGMKKEWIMSEEARIEKKQRILENRERRMAEKRLSDVKDVSSLSESTIQLQQQTNLMQNASGVAQLAAAVVGQLPNPLEQIPQPPVTSSTFRPPIYTDVQHQSTSSILAANEAAFAAAAASTNFVTNTQQLANQVAQAQLAVAQAQQVAQVAQAHQVASQLQQAQLEHHIQQQAAHLQQQAAQQIVANQAQQVINAAVQHHQQQQLATAIVAAAMAPQQSTVQQTQNAVAAASLVAAAANAAAAPSILPPTQTQTTSILPQMVTPALTLVDVPTPAPPPPVTQNNPDYITLPKDVVIKLFESKLESEQQNQTFQPPPLKCQCRCQCGRYSNEILIVDKVMADLLQSSAQQNNRPLNEQHRPSSHIDVVSVDQKVAKIENKMDENGEGKISLLEEEMDNVVVDPDCTIMTSVDHDNLNEVLHANEVWAQELEPSDAQRHKSSNHSKNDLVNMADGAIRRLVKMTKRIPSFRTLNHHDQLTLLKNTCMEYLILRGAMSYNAQANVWSGPTPNSGYAVKMDAMKDSQVALFESSIKFYATFREEWRTNENVMLLLGMIVLYNPNIPDIQDPTPIAVQNRKYRSILKRLLYSLCNQDAAKACREFKNLIDKLALLRPLNAKAMRMVQEVDSEMMEPLVREMFAIEQRPSSSTEGE